MQLKAFTIDELERNPGGLRELEDPHGFVPRMLPDWIGLLTSNPYAEKDDLALILAVHDKVVVGRLGFYAGPAAYGGSEDRTFWMDGFFMEPEARKTGTGGTLMLYAARYCKSLLACGSPSPDAQRLYEAIGMREVSRLKRYLYFYRAHPVVDWYLKNRLLRSCLGGLLTPCLRFYYFLRRPRRCSPLIFKAVSRFGNEIDQLPPPSEECYFPKPARLLNWVLQRRKLWAFEIYRESGLAGYCLLKRVHDPGGGPHDLPKMTVGRLLDLYLSRPSADEERVLLSFALDFFGKQNVDAFECQVHGPGLTARCKEFGMIHKGGRRVLFKPLPGHTLDESASWYLTFGTADVILMRD